MKKTALLITTLVFAIFNTNAIASEIVSDPKIQSDVEIAIKYWNADTVCPSGISVIREQWLPDTNVWAAAVSGVCTIALDPDWFPSLPTTNVKWYDAVMCSIIVHETGHIMGNLHSEDPRSIMYFEVPLNVIKGCPFYFDENKQVTALSYNDFGTKTHKYPRGMRIKRKATRVARKKF